MIIFDAPAVDCSEYRSKQELVISSVSVYEEFHRKTG